jgi:hypothetical protein
MRVVLAVLLSNQSKEPPFVFYSPLTNMMVHLVSEQGKTISVENGNLLLGRGSLLVRSSSFFC